LFGGSFDFLKADDIRVVSLEPEFDLSLTRPDAVDVPGGYAERRSH
jgi:hypothetical protein